VQRNRLGRLSRPRIAGRKEWEQRRDDSEVVRLHEYVQ
jgi:hypothetical protein